MAAALLAAVQAAEPEKAKLTSKLSHHSPDGKFAMRIVHEAEDETLHSDAIRRIELIAVSSGKALAQLLSEDDVETHFEGWRLLWSPDSKWCAFYYQHPRTGYTTVFRRVKDKFTAANKPWALTDGTAAGDVRNQHVQPIRWTDDGRLLLCQWTISRTPDRSVESYSELTAGYDEKKRTFRILKARELTLEESEKLDEEIEKE
jgi:hypothetical protein